MKIAHKDVVIPDHPVMKKAQTVAEALWKDHGREEGITITSGKNGVHGPGSWHYYGAAVDLRTRYENRQYWQDGSMAEYPADSRAWDDGVAENAYSDLKAALPEYDVIWHNTHIHVEPGDALARKWGLLL